MIRPEDRPGLQPWADTWYRLVAEQYIATYIVAIQSAELLPPEEVARDDLLALHLLQKAFLEINSELSERPDWAVIPLRGAVRMLGPDPADPVIRL